MGLKATDRGWSVAITSTGTNACTNTSTNEVILYDRVLFESFVSSSSTSTRTCKSRGTLL